MRVYHLRASLLNFSVLPELNRSVEKGLFHSHSFSVTTLSPFLDADFWERTPAFIAGIHDVQMAKLTNTFSGANLVFAVFSPEVLSSSSVK